MISNFILPLLILIIIVYSYFKINIYDSFIEGAKESFNICIDLFPTLLAMIFGVNIFIKSGFLEIIFNLFNLNNIPSEAIMLPLLRPISGSTSLALLNNIFSKYGPDSFIGTICSVIQGSSDTTLYVISLYFGSIGIKNIKYAMKAGLLSDFIGIIISILVVFLLF